jgi:hypothetical protein
MERGFQPDGTGRLKLRRHAISGREARRAESHGTGPQGGLFRTRQHTIAAEAMSLPPSLCRPVGGLGGNRFPAADETAFSARHQTGRPVLGTGMPTSAMLPPLVSTPNHPELASL